MNWSNTGSSVVPRTEGMSALIGAQQFPQQNPSKSQFGESSEHRNQALGGHCQSAGGYAMLFEQLHPQGPVASSDELMKSSFPASATQVQLPQQQQQFDQQHRLPTRRQPQQRQQVPMTLPLPPQQQKQQVAMPQAQRQVHQHNQTPPTFQQAQHHQQNMLPYELLQSPMQQQQQQQQQQQPAAALTAFQQPHPQLEQIMLRHHEEKERLQRQVLEYQAQLAQLQQQHELSLNIQRARHQIEQQMLRQNRLDYGFAPPAPPSSSSSGGGCGENGDLRAWPSNSWQQNAAPMSVAPPQHAQHYFEAVNRGHRQQQEEEQEQQQRASPTTKRAKQRHDGGAAAAGVPKTMAVLAMKAAADRNARARYLSDATASTTSSLASLREDESLVPEDENSPWEENGGSRGGKHGNGPQANKYAQGPPPTGTAGVSLGGGGVGGGPTLFSATTCIGCAKAKVKCNKVFPACGRCARLGTACHPQLRGRGRPRKVQPEAAPLNSTGPHGHHQTGSGLGGGQGWDFTGGGAGATMMAASSAARRSSSRRGYGESSKTAAAGGFSNGASRRGEAFKGKSYGCTYYGNDEDEAEERGWDEGNEEEEEEEEEEEDSEGSRTSAETFRHKQHYLSTLLKYSSNPLKRERDSEEEEGGDEEEDDNEQDKEYEDNELSSSSSFASSSSSSGSGSCGSLLTLAAAVAVVGRAEV